MQGTTEGRLSSVKGPANSSIPKKGLAASLIAKDAEQSSRANRWRRGRVFVAREKKKGPKKREILHQKMVRGQPSLEPSAHCKGKATAISLVRNHYVPPYKRGGITVKRRRPAGERGMSNLPGKTKRGGRILIRRLQGGRGVRYSNIS